VVQAEGGGSGAPPTIGPYLTVRVAARLRVNLATIYRLCEIGELSHVRVLNAIRVGEGDLRTYLRNPRQRGAVCERPRPIGRAKHELGTGSDDGVQSFDSSSRLAPHNQSGDYR